MVKPLSEEYVVNELLTTWGKKFQEPKANKKSGNPVGFFGAAVECEKSASGLRYVRTHRFKRIGQGEFAGQPEETGLWEGFNTDDEVFVTTHLGDTLQELRGARQFVFSVFKETDLVNENFKNLKCWDIKKLIAALGKKEVMKQFPQEKRNKARYDLIRSLMEELAYGEKEVTVQLLKFYEAHPEAMKTYSQPGKMAGRVRAMLRELLGDVSLKFKDQNLQVRTELMSLGCEELAKAY